MIIFGEKNNFSDFLEKTLIQQNIFSDFLENCLKQFCKTILQNNFQIWGPKTQISEKQFFKTMQNNFQNNVFFWRSKMGPKSAQKLRQWHSGYESTQL